MYVKHYVTNILSSKVTGYKILELAGNLDSA